MRPREKRHSILTRFTVVTVVALTLAFFTSFVLLHFYNVWCLRNDGNSLVDYAKTRLESSLDEIDYDQCFSSSTSSSYQDLRIAMRDVCDQCSAENLYLYTVDENHTKRTYLFAVTTNTETDKWISDVRGLGSVSTEPFSDLELQALEGKDPKEPETVDTEFGYDLSFYRRIELPDNHGYAILGLDYDFDLIDTIVNEDTLAFAVPMVVAVFGIAGIELLLLRLYIIKPIRGVSASMRTFAQEGKAPEEPLEPKNNDEIGEIVTSFNQMTTDIEHYVAHIEEMTEERVAATTELQVAQRIQQSLVPSVRHEEGFGYDAFAFARTARAVGGDFYDLTPLDDGKLLIIVADVSGKGISAALYMSMCLTLLHSKLQDFKDPAVVLNEANDIIEQSNTENMFVTVLAGFFDQATGVLTYANAGHTPPLLTNGTYLDPDPGIALGLFEGAGIVNETVTLKPGEGILFYTDGAVEANNSDKEFFGEDRLAKAVAGSTSAEEAVRAAVDAVDTFVGETEQFDDLTLLSLFAKGDETQCWNADLAPDLASFQMISEHLRELDVSKADLSRITLACDEAFANVANYANATSVTVSATRSNDLLVIRLSDDGTPFDPLSNEPAEREFEDLEFGGMGIKFIKESCDEVSYEYAEGRNVLTMSFNL